MIRPERRPPLVRYEEGAVMLACGEVRKLGHMMVRNDMKSQRYMAP